MKSRIKIIKIGIITTVLTTLLQVNVIADGVGSKVHIKKQRETVTYDDILNEIMESNKNYYNNLSTIFENNTAQAVGDLLKLPDNTDKPQNNDNNDNKDDNTPQPDDNDGSYGKWFEIKKDILWPDSKHTWSIMSYTAVTDRSSNQWKYMHDSAYVFTDDHGFRKYKVDGKEYYSIALAAYYACEGKTPNDSGWKKSDFWETIGHSFQVKLEDGKIIDCILGDVKSTDDANMRTDYKGHGEVDMPKDTTPTSVVETVMDGTVWNVSSPPSAKNKDGTPWVSDPVAIRKGPKLPV